MVGFLDKLKDRLGKEAERLGPRANEIARRAVAIKGKVRPLVLPAYEAAGQMADGVGGAVSRTLDIATERRNATTSVLGGDDLREVESSQGTPMHRLCTQRVPAHVVSAVACLAAAGGILAEETEILQFTRSVMDNDAGAIQELVGRLFDAKTADVINRWMDTAPGADAAGGFAHRMAGHDWHALTELVGQHDATDALVGWFNHVWLRDFWTPHGVPYLPMGSSSAYDWLLAESISPSTALDLLTVNAAEAASGILLFGTVLRARNAWQRWRDDKMYSQRLAEAERLIARGNDKGAIIQLRQAEAASSAKTSPELRLNSAVLAAERAGLPTATLHSEWASAAYAIATRASTLGEPGSAIDYHGGTKVSFEGLAAVVVSSTYAQHLRVQNAPWDEARSHIDRGIGACLKLADIQLSGKLAGKVGVRPYSALTNQLLALEMASASAASRQGIDDPLAIRALVEATLERIAESGEAHAAYAGKVHAGLKNRFRVYPKRGVPA